MQLKLKKNGKKNGNGNGHSNGNGNGHGHGNALKIALLVIAVVLAGFLVYRLAGRLGGPAYELWVAKTALEAGSVVGADDLEKVTRRGSEAPREVVTDRQQIEGRRLTRPVQAGEPFVRGSLARPQSLEERAASLTEILPAGRVLTRVLMDIDSVLMHELEFGDRFEIVAAGGTSDPDQPAARVVASDAFFFAWVDPALLSGNGGRNGNGNGSYSNGNGNGQASGMMANLLSMPVVERGRSGPSATSSTKLLVALEPGDVLPVTEAAATGGRLSMVLHGRREVQAGQMLTLPSARPVVVELIDGAKRERIPFVQ